MPINVALVVCLSLALLLVVIALAREMRLRRALQLLLARLLALWRNRFEPHDPPMSRPPTAGHSRPTPPDDRLS